MKIYDLSTIKLKRPKNVAFRSKIPENQFPYNLFKDEIPFEKLDKNRLKSSLQMMLMLLRKNKEEELQKVNAAIELAFYKKIKLLEDSIHKNECISYLEEHFNVVIKPKI